MGTIGARLASTPTSTKLSLAGLGVGIVGLVIQWSADPAKFGGFPPGIIVIAVCAALVVAASGRWWAPVFSVLISLWIVLGGLAADKLIPNLRSGDAGTVAGNVVMSLGLLFAAATGVVAMVTGRRARGEAMTR